jgi:hypothetical protein
MMSAANTPGTRAAASLAQLNLLVRSVGKQYLQARHLMQASLSLQDFIGSLKYSTAGAKFEAVLVQFHMLAGSAGGA